MGDDKGFIGRNVRDSAAARESLQPLGDILRRTFGGQEQEEPWASFRADLADQLMRIDY